MTVEADLFQTLNALFGGRFYPDVAPDSAPTPYGVFQQVGGQTVSFLELGVPSKKNGRFQIACWSTTRLEASAIGMAVENAMLVATAFSATPLGSMTGEYEEETRRFGTRQDFSIWSDR